MNGGAQEARAQTASDTAPAEDQVAENQFSDVSAALNLWAKQIKLLEEAVADDLRALSEIELGEGCEALPRALNIRAWAT